MIEYGGVGERAQRGGRQLFRRHVLATASFFSLVFAFCTRRPSGSCEFLCSDFAISFFAKGMIDGVAIFRRCVSATASFLSVGSLGPCAFCNCKSYGAYGFAIANLTARMVFASFLEAFRH